MLITIQIFLIYLVNHCVQSRHIILHWKNCATPNCSICGSLKKPSALRPQNSIRKLIYLFYKKTSFFFLSSKRMATTITT
jgi:hypothetical protein